MKLVILTLVVAFAVAGVPDSRAGGVSEHRNARCEALGLHEGMNLDVAAQDHNKHRAAEALEESRIALEDLQKLYAVIRRMSIPSSATMERSTSPKQYADSELYAVTWSLVEDDSDRYAREWMLTNRPIAEAVHGFARRFTKVRNVTLETEFGAFSLFRTPSGVVFDVGIPGLGVEYLNESAGFNVIGCDTETLGIKWINPDRHGDPDEVYIVFCHDEKHCVGGGGDAEGERRFRVADWLAASVPPQTK